jgi:hypothetical protein
MTPGRRSAHRLAALPLRNCVAARAGRRLLIRLSRLVILRAAGISDFDRSQDLALLPSRSGFQVQKRNVDARRNNNATIKIAPSSRLRHQMEEEAHETS